MKKIFHFLIAALSVATIAMTLTSCSAGGDGTEGTDGDIIGSWECHEWSYRALWKFRPDGTMVWVSMHQLFEGDDPEDFTIEYCNWSISGNKLITDEEDFIIKTLTKKELVIGSANPNIGITITFYRVADSVVNEYIEKYGKK